MGCEVGARGRELSATCSSRRHLPAGVQGPPRGRAPSSQGPDIVLIGHEGHPEVIGTMGQLPEGAATLVETAGTRPPRAGIRTGARLHDADDAVRRRHRRDRRDPQAALPRHRGPAQGRHLLRHHQPAGGGEGDRGPIRHAMLVVGAPNTFELHAPRRGRGARRLHALDAGPARRRHRLGRRSARSAPSASPPGHPRRRFWSRR
jgi:hypothetical protein